MTEGLTKIFIATWLVNSLHFSLFPTRISDRSVPFSHITAPVKEESHTCIRNSTLCLNNKVAVAMIFKYDTIIVAALRVQLDIRLSLSLGYRHPALLRVILYVDISFTGDKQMSVVMVWRWNSHHDGRGGACSTFIQWFGLKDPVVLKPDYGVMYETVFVWVLFCLSNIWISLLAWVKSNFGPNLCRDRLE